MYKNCTGKTKLIYLKTKSGGGGCGGEAGNLQFKFTVN